MKKMLSFAVAALFALISSADEINSTNITSDIENDYGQNPYGAVCEMSVFKQKAATLTWCSLGTSITWYNDHPNPEVGLTHGYQDRTIEKLGLNKANFFNRGVSGARVGDNNTEPPSGTAYDIYTLEWGINDWMHGTRVGNIEVFRRRLADPNYTAEDILPNPWATFACRYATVINQIKAINPNAIIILMTPRKSYGFNNRLPANWWTIGSADSAAEEPSYLYDYVKLIRAIAAETGYPLVDQFRYAANQENLASLSIDVALHPNDAGFEVMANLLAPVMSQAIETKYGITRCTHEGTTSVVPGTAATCTEDGTTDKTICTNPDCQMVLQASEAIPALGHNWGEWDVTTPATESATGLKERTCQRTGCDAHEEQIIPRVGEIVALRNIAVVTKVGEPPVLPAQVAGLRADGTVAGQCDVVWAEHDAPSAIGKTTITGTATVDNAPMSVTASVRATVEQSDDDIKNIVLGVPPTTAYGMSGISYPNASLNSTTYEKQVNGQHENNSWPWYGSQGTSGAYNGKFAKEVFAIEFTLAKTATVKGFCIWHITDSTWMKDVIKGFVDVSTDGGVTWTSVEVTGGEKPNSMSAVTGGSVYKYNYELATPAAGVTHLRLKLSPTGVTEPEPGDASTWVGLKISEIEVFGIEGESGGPVDPLTTDTLSALAVDNVAVQGFAPTTLSYTIEESLAITSATSTDNMGITILPRANGAAHVVTLSESGSTKTYTVNMPAACEHATTHLESAIPVTCMTDGYTGDTVCDSCGETIESGSVIPAPRQHDWGDWTVTTPATKTETGLKERDCKRCDAHEEQDIPAIADVVALRNVAVVTMVGTALELPATVAGLVKNGATAGDFEVSWDSVETPNAPGVTTVNGTAQVGDEEMAVTASVRATTTPSADENLVLGVPPSNVYPMSGFSYPSSNHESDDIRSMQVNGYYDSNTYQLRWNGTAGTSGDYANRYAKEVFVFEFALSEPSTVKRFVNWHTAWLLDQITLFVEVSKDGGTSWTPVEVTGGAKPEPSTVQDAYKRDYEVYKYGYELATPAMEVTNIRLKISPWGVETPEPGDFTWISGAWEGIAICEMEIFGVKGDSGPTEPQAIDTLSALEVDNVAVTGFAPTTLEYTVDNGAAITKATPSFNMGVTILDKSDGEAHVVTFAENGVATKNYKVLMPYVCLHPSTTVTGASEPTCTEPGSTGTETCDECHAVVREAEEIPATGHQHTTVTGAKDATCTEPGSTGAETCDKCHAVIHAAEEIPALGHAWNGGETTTEPTCTEKGVMTYTCTREGCSATQTEDINPLGHQMGEWGVITEPTEEETGLKRRDCQRNGCDYAEEEVIPVLAALAALRNVAVVTEVNQALTAVLPPKVKGLKSDGTLADGEFDVTWRDTSARTDPGVTQVIGDVTVDGKAMTVTAFVRAVATEVVNYSPSAIETTEANIIKGTIDKPYLKKYLYLTTKAADPLTSGVWDDLICYGNEVEVTIEWTSPVSVSKVRVYFQQSGNYGPPENVRFYNESGAEIAWTEGDNNDNGGAGAWHDYVFTAPQTLSKLGFYQKRDAGQHMLFLRRVWALGGAGSADPTTTDTLTSLEVDGEAVTGFAAETTCYSIEGGQAITKATNNTDNVAVTILPKYEGNAYAVTLAEDGESTKTYTVSMPPPHEHVYGEWQVITPATVYAPGLRRRVCTVSGCSVKEEEVIPMISRQTVKWIDVSFTNYVDASTITNAQVDTVDRGTWAKPDADDTATVAHGDPALAALVVTNQYLCYAAKAKTSAGRDATVEFKAKFQKPNADTLPPALDLGQTAVFVFPDGKGACYKAYTSAGWVKLTGATPDFTKFVTITIEFRYEYGERSAMVKIDDVVCTPDGAETPWFTLAGSATQLTCVDFFGGFDLGPFWGDCYTRDGKRGFMFIISSAAAVAP